MNETDKKPDFKIIYKIVNDYFKKTQTFDHGPFDETYFSLRVYESAKEIIKKLGVECNQNIILVSAILHDIGKTKLDVSKVYDRKGMHEDSHIEWRKHAKLGLPLAKKILKNLGHSEDFISEVCYLIENHDNRQMKEKTIDLMILQDADYIADWGFAGFIRAFVYGGKFERSIIDSIKYLNDDAKNDMSTRRSKINLDISKEITKDKIKLQKELISTISKDIDSDLLD